MSEKNNSIMQQILQLNGSLEKIAAKFNYSKNALSRNDIVGYTDTYTEAMRMLESATLRARNLANYGYKTTGFYNYYKNAIEGLANSIYNIQITKNDYYYRIKLPCLLPHIRELDQQNIFSEPLNAAIRKYQKDNGSVGKMDSVVLYFVNHIKDSLGKTRIRDNDNYEYKQIINPLCYWFLADDSFEYCQFFLTSQLENIKESYTEVFVVPSNKFTDLLISKKFGTDISSGEAKTSGNNTTTLNLPKKNNFESWEFS